MAKLIIDGTDHGIHAFVVQLRSLIDHKVVPGTWYKNLITYIKLKCKFKELKSETLVESSDSMLQTMAILNSTG